MRKGREKQQPVAAVPAAVAVAVAVAAASSGAASASPQQSRIGWAVGNGVWIIDTEAPVKVTEGFGRAETGLTGRPGHVAEKEKGSYVPEKARE